MKTFAATLLLQLLASIASVSCAFNPCLYNREDYLPCIDHLNSGVVSPGANQYTVHATRFQRGANGFPVCVKRKEGELVRAIEDIGTQNKFIFSPGAEQFPPVNYVNQIIVEYNVRCQEGTTAYIQFDALDLELSNCFDGSQTRCRDYIEVDAGNGGTTEYCGNDLPSEPFLVGTGHFILKLRTSFYTSFPGFRVFVTCFNASFANIDTNTCTSPGGVAKKKRATYELVDIAPPQQELSVKKPQAQPLTFTNADMTTLRSLTKSLFNVALSQARRKITSWPPASYSRNDPDDILDIEDLAKPVTRRPITLRPSLSPVTPSIVKPSEQPIPIDPVIGLPVQPKSALLARRRRKLSISQGSEAQLSSQATLEAVRYENACSPILRSVTRSYLTVAQRLAPTQLQTARNEFEQEISLLQPIK